LPGPVRFAKIFRFPRTPNHFYNPRHPVPLEGRWPSSLTRGGMRWTRRRDLTKRAGCGRRSRVVLTPRRRRQVRERKKLSRVTVTRKPDRRGEHEGNRKTTAQGMPDASAEPVCSCAHLTLHCVRDRGVQRASGIPCALYFGGAEIVAQPRAKHAAGPRSDACEKCARMQRLSSGRETLQREHAIFRVVPANAGTHNHRLLWLGKAITHVPPRRVGPCFRRDDGWPTERRKRVQF
jgi:hypothetical protein